MVSTYSIMYLCIHFKKALVLTGKIVPPGPFDGRWFVWGSLLFSVFSTLLLYIYSVTSLSFFTCSQERFMDAFTGSAVPADTSSVYRKMQTGATIPVGTTHKKQNKKY